MFTHAIWCLLFVSTKACVLVNPLINNDIVSNRGLQFERVDDVFYMAPNTTLTLTCKINFTEIGISWDQVAVKWFLNGERFNATKIDLKLSKYLADEESYLTIFYKFESGSTLNRSELKCTVETIDCIRQSSVFLQVANNVSKLNVVEPTNAVTLRTAELKSASEVAIAIAVILITVGVLLTILYIKFRRRSLISLEEKMNHVKESKSYNEPDPSVTPVSNSEAIEYSYTYTHDDEQVVPSYLEIIPNTTGKPSPKFLPLPNIPGRTPPSSTRNSPVSSIVGDNENIDIGEDPIYNEIHLYENTIKNKPPEYNDSNT